MSAVEILKKGQYLAPSYQTYDLGHLLISKTRYKEPVQTGVWHMHERPMVSMVLYGGNIESREKKEIERTNGSVNYYHAHEIHKNEYKIFPSVHIGLEIETAMLEKYGYTESMVNLAIHQNTDTELFLLQLLKETSIPDSQAKKSAELTFVSFIEQSKLINDESFRPTWMQTIKDILHDRWNQNVSLDELSEQADIHPITISKYFKKYFHCTLSEYMRKLKVKKAISYLTSSHYSLTEVAHMCGFADQSHFTRVFKEHTGLLPKAFIKI